MIYLVSDLHGGANTENFLDYVKTAHPEDTLLILGDIELHFRDTEENRAFSVFFESLSCNIAFLDGNHENFDRLYDYPEEDWHGGRVHRISPNIVHLMRGYVFEIEGQTFLTMGGCKSSQKWFDMGLCWEQEIPTAAEISRAYTSLAEHSNCVDYILTHKYRIDDPSADPMTLEGFFVYVDRHVTFRHWYSGHWHRYRRLDERHTVIAQTVIPL